MQNYKETIKVVLLSGSKYVAERIFLLGHLAQCLESFYLFPAKKQKRQNIIHYILPFLGFFYRNGRFESIIHMIYELKQIVTLTEKQIERITFCTDFTEEITVALEFLEISAASSR